MRTASIVACHVIARGRGGQCRQRSVCRVSGALWNRLWSTSHYCNHLFFSIPHYHCDHSLICWQACHQHLPSLTQPSGTAPHRAMHWMQQVPTELWAGGAIRTLTLFFFFLLWHPLSDVWWLPTNRHRLPTNRHRLPTNRHRLPTNRHRLPTNRHRLPTGRHRRAYWTLRVFFFFSLWHPLALGVSGQEILGDRQCRAAS